MLRKIPIILPLLLVILSGANTFTVAQDNVIVSGLNDPRHLVYTEDGTLYVAEAGRAGDSSALGQSGEDVLFGLTGQLTTVSPDGEKIVLIDGLLSSDVGFGQIRGFHAVYVTDESYWLVMGDGPEVPPEGASTAAVVAVNRETREITQSIDLHSFEKDENPDGNPTDISSNPTDLDVGEDGTFYIVDASANALLSWTDADGLQVFAVWPPDSTGESSAAVPTAADFGPDGNLYVGFLTGFPFTAGAARIEVWNLEGELVKTYKGLTLVTDVLVTDDGSIYAVQLASSGNFTPNSGSVVKVSDDGIEIVADGLNTPYGITQAPDGTLSVSINSVFSAPNSGQVISIGEG